MEFELKDDYIEMSKLLKLTGICDSGGMAKQIIIEGLVKYNGEVDYRKRLKVRKGDVVEVEGEKIKIV